MSQPNSDKPTNPPATPSAQPQAAFHENVIYEGNAAWIGRFGAFFWTFVVAAVLIAIPIALQIWAPKVEVPWWATAGAIVLAILLVLLQIGYHNTIRYRVTNYRLDYERGVLSRSIDSLELWHVDDLKFHQSLFERLLGVGTIVVTCREHSQTELLLVSIPNARQIFEEIKTSVLAAKRQRGLLELDQ